jgi:predicted small secreted protein
MKKNILISLSLIVIASFLLVGCGNENSFAGQAIKGGINKVNSLGAKSCDGDFSCEVRNLDAIDSVFIGESLTVDGLSTFKGNISASDTILAFGIKLRSGRSSYFPLRSNGTAYACFDRDGNIFRKDSPCIPS